MGSYFKQPFFHGSLAVFSLVWLSTYPVSSFKSRVKAITWQTHVVLVPFESAVLSTYSPEKNNFFVSESEKFRFYSLLQVHFLFLSIAHLYYLPYQMTFPILYLLQNGTKVEVNPNTTGDKFIFDLFHNNIMFDSFTWTPEANLRKVDIGISDSESLEGRYLEALALFRKMK